jgi:hypothetical protein
MNTRTILHIILWVVTVGSFGMSWWSHHEWVARNAPADSSRYYWIVYALIGVICIAVWFFTREKEEEISITRS